MGPGVRATVDDATGRQFAPVKLMALGVLGTTKKCGAGNELTDGGARYRVERVEPPPNPSAFGHAWGDALGTRSVSLARVTRDRPCCTRAASGAPKRSSAAGFVACRAH
jgi:hypothetical protein